MTEQGVRDIARKRAKRKLDFYNHLLIYVIVNAMLFAINVISSPGDYWFFWPLLGWGVAVAIHAVKTFMMPPDSELLDRMTEREIRKDRERHS